VWTAVTLTSAEKRRRLILHRTRGNGRVQVAELADFLEVAAETVRRDLRILEDQGLLRRPYGGALPVDEAPTHASLHQPATSATADIRSIATTAMSQLRLCESLFIDEGNTALAVAEQLLTHEQPLHVVTRCISIAAVLAARPSTTVLMLGGVVQGATGATLGPAATAMLANLNIDMAVLSASTISLEHGVTTAHPEAVELKQAAIRAARRRILVADHATFHTSNLCRYADVQDFHAIITDSGLPTGVAARYQAAGTELISA
jgi:DeoR family transcriptional regulator, fructose operon transcriptional repressor